MNPNEMYGLEASPFGWPEPYAGMSQIELDARLYAELMEDPEQRRLEAIYEAQEAAAEAEYALRTGRRLTTRQG